MMMDGDLARAQGFCMAARNVPTCAESALGGK